MLEKTKITNNFFLLMCGIVVFMICSSKVAVIAAEYDRKTTPRERAIFAFFRNVGIAPDYDFWIKTSDNFKSVSENRRDTYILNETLRLGRGYSSYDEEQDLLKLTIKVLVKYLPETDIDNPRITFSFMTEDKSYVPTFSYAYGEDVISLIIDRLAAFSDVTLNDAQNEEVSRKIPYEGDVFDAKLTVHVRVKSANNNKPVIVDKMKQWIMVGDIAFLKCEVSGHMGNDQMLWDYVAPWHEKLFEMQKLSKELKYPHPYDLFKD